MAVTRPDEASEGEERWVTTVATRSAAWSSSSSSVPMPSASSRRAARRGGRRRCMKREYDFSGGRRGPVLRPRRKTRVTMYLDDDVLAAFRERAESEGRGYQPLIN